jgi:hypothetical protein
MVFNAAFTHISVISWLSVLLLEQTRVPVKTTDLPQVTDELYHLMSHRVHLALIEIRTRNVIMVIGTDCICNCKSNYHTITTTTALRVA